MRYTLHLSTYIHILYSVYTHPTYLNNSMQRGWTPLMIASFNGHVDIVRTLIKADIQVNTQEEVCCSTSRKTLHRTSHRHRVLLYKEQLATHGEFIVCFCAQDGWTALHLAAQEGKVDVVRLLTEAQARVNIQTKVNFNSTNSW